MKQLVPSLLLALLALPGAADAQNTSALKQALTFHASFDKGFDADFSRGDKAAVVRGKQGTVPLVANEELQLVPGGRFGGGLHFTKKGGTQPRFKGAPTAAEVKTLHGLKTGVRELHP